MRPVGSKGKRRRRFGRTAFLAIQGSVGGRLSVFEHVHLQPAASARYRALDGDFNIAAKRACEADQTFQRIAAGAAAKKFGHVGSKPSSDETAGRSL